MLFFSTCQGNCSFFKKRSIISCHYHLNDCVSPRLMATVQPCAIWPSLSPTASRVPVYSTHASAMLAAFWFYTKYGSKLGGGLIWPGWTKKHLDIKLDIVESPSLEVTQNSTSLKPSSVNEDKLMPSLTVHFCNQWVHALTQPRIGLLQVKGEKDWTFRVKYRFHQIVT